MQFNAVGITAAKERTELLQAFKSVLNTGQFLDGPTVRTLEQNLQIYFDVPFAITVASGHDALCLSLHALGLPAKSEVLFPVSAYPTAFPIASVGLTPVAVDVTANNQLHAQDLAQRITPRSKVLLLTHLYGQVGDLDRILQIARRNQLIVIEDCAQAFGTTWQNKPVGTLGDIGCFSFYPSKNWGTLGDGGAIITRSKKINSYLRQAKQYGEKTRYQSQFVAGHSRLPDLQAASLLVYLEHLTNWQQRKERVARWYHELIKRNHLTIHLQILGSDSLAKPNIHLFVVRATKRDELQKYLSSVGIPTLVHYPQLTTQVSAFKNYDFVKAHYPQAEKLVHSLLSLPFHPFLTKKEVADVVQHLAVFYQSH